MGAGEPGDATGAGDAGDADEVEEALTGGRVAGTGLAGGGSGWVMRLMVSVASAFGLRVRYTPASTSRTRTTTASRV